MVVMISGGDTEITKQAIEAAKIVLRENKQVIIVAVDNNDNETRLSEAAKSFCENLEIENLNVFSFEKKVPKHSHRSKKWETPYKFHK